MQSVRSATRSIGRRVSSLWGRRGRGLLTGATALVVLCSLCVLGSAVCSCAPAAGTPPGPSPSATSPATPVPTATRPATPTPAPEPSATPTPEAEPTPVPTVRPEATSTAPPAPTPAPAGYPFVASRESDVFHRASCHYVDRIKPENLIGFSSREEAIAAGYRPCKVCNP